MYIIVNGQMHHCGHTYIYVVYIYIFFFVLSCMHICVFSTIQVCVGRHLYIFFDTNTYFLYYYTFRGSFGRYFPYFPKFGIVHGPYSQDRFGFLSAARYWNTSFHASILKNDREPYPLSKNSFAWTIYTRYVFFCLASFIDFGFRFFDVDMFLHPVLFLVYICNRDSWFLWRLVLQRIACLLDTCVRGPHFNFCRGCDSVNIYQVPGMCTILPLQCFLVIGACLPTTDCDVVVSR